jgi:hypothetical protein
MVLTSAVGHEIWIESQSDILPSVEKKNGGLFIKEQMGAVGSQIARTKPKDYSFFA